MRQDEDGRRKLEKTDERITNKIAKHLEKAERKRELEGQDQEKQKQLNENFYIDRIDNAVASEEYKQM